MENYSIVFKIVILSFFLWSNFENRNKKYKVENKYLKFLQRNTNEQYTCYFYLWE